jgi:putative cardiolipin synthase
MKISLIFIFGLCLLAPLAYADKVRIIETTADAAQVRIDLIQQAKRSIDAQYYIVGNDYFTLAGLALLSDAARRGCEVRLIIDGRSNKLSAAVHAELKRDGVAVKLYHPFTLAKLGVFLRRMHDKGLTIDRKYMIRGGRNIEGSYFGYWKRNFIDRDVYVEGKAVAQSVAYFNELWNSAEVAPVVVRDPAGRRAEEGRKILDAAREKLRASRIVKLNTGNNWGARARNVPPIDFLHDPVGKKDVEFGIAQSLRQNLRRTRHSVVIETPYLVPTKELFADLAELKKRGVKNIEMITNSIASNDELLVQLGYETSKKKLLQLGVDLWEFNGPDTLHAKSAVLDDKLALIGSFNIDPRSQHLNTETAVAIRDSKTARQLRNNIEAHKRVCTHITADQPVARAQTTSAAQRLKVSFFKALLPLLRGQL